MGDCGRRFLRSQRGQSADPRADHPAQDRKTAISRGGSMILMDQTLRELFSGLDVMAQRAIALHVLLGTQTEESRAAIRRIRASLKRKARTKLPKRFNWLA